MDATAIIFLIELGSAFYAASTSNDVGLMLLLGVGYGRRIYGENIEKKATEKMGER